MAEFDNNTCARLEVQEELHDLTVKKTLFVKSVWEPASSPPTSLSLAISDGRQAWTFEGSEAFVNEMAEMLDKNVHWVMEKLKFYLCVGQPGVTYHFTKTRDNHRKLSFEIQDKDTNPSLTANLLMLNASSENVTSDVLDFLLHGAEKLTVEYLEKCRSFDRMEAKNKALLEKIEHLKNEKLLFQQDIFPKFGLVINSKKRKLRELREKLKRIEQLEAKGKIEKIDTTSNSSDDNDEEESDHQISLPEKWTKRGGGSDGRPVGGIVDPDITEPCLDRSEIEYSKQNDSRNAVAALVGDTSYTGLNAAKTLMFCVHEYINPVPVVSSGQLCNMEVSEEEVHLTKRFLHPDLTHDLGFYCRCSSKILINLTTLNFRRDP